MLPQVLLRYCLPLLTTLLLGSCQRATYSFQPVGCFQATEARTEALVPAIAAVAEPVAASLPPAAASAARPPHYRRPRPHRNAAARQLARRLPWQRSLASQPAAVVPHAFSGLKAVARPTADLQPGRHRSRAVAIILAVLSCSYLPFSLHNFYLGYYGRGIAAIALLLAGIYLLALGSFGVIFGPTNLAVIGYFGLALLVGWFIWQLTDLFRICRGELKPNGGEYRRRAAQPNPASGAPGR